MKILVMSYLFVMEWVVLIKNLIILTLAILIMMNMIQILLFLSDLLLGIVNLKKWKALKKELKKIEELMPLAWHPNRWWNFCMSEDEKNEAEPIFNEQCF